jgi:hypothetical protein
MGNLIRVPVGREELKQGRCSEQQEWKSKMLGSSRGYLFISIFSAPDNLN